MQIWFVRKSLHSIEEHHFKNLHYCIFKTFWIIWYGKKYTYSIFPLHKGCFIGVNTDHIQIEKGIFSIKHKIIYVKEVRSIKIIYNNINLHFFFYMVHKTSIQFSNKCDSLNFKIHICIFFFFFVIILLY